MKKLQSLSLIYRFRGTRRIVVANSLVKFSSFFFSIVYLPFILEVFDKNKRLGEGIGWMGKETEEKRNEWIIWKGYKIKIENTWR